MAEDGGLGASELCVVAEADSACASHCGAVDTGGKGVTLAEYSGSICQRIARVQGKGCLRKGGGQACGLMGLFVVWKVAMGADILHDNVLELSADGEEVVPDVEEGGAGLRGWSTREDGDE